MKDDNEISREKSAHRRSRLKLNDRQKHYLEFKYAAGVFAGIAGSIILAPILLGISIAIVIDDGFPIFFKQKRVGKGCSHFMIYKFRTMKNNTPHNQPTHLLANPDQYITKVGHFLRKYSLDELPQLLNIAKGEMSIIGPRPALWNQYDLIEERNQYGANDIKPGLTGWAQIHGRDELEIEEKAALDGYYAKHIGPVIDLQCFFCTVMSVLKSDGVVEGGTGALKK